MEIISEPQPCALISTPRRYGIIASSLSSPLLRPPRSSTENGNPSLPLKGQPRLLRHARHTFLNVYRRLFSLVTIANLIGLGVVLARNARSSSPPLSDLATAASANVMAAILIRQDYIVNLL